MADFLRLSTDMATRVPSQGDERLMDGASVCDDAVEQSARDLATRHEVQGASRHTRLLMARFHESRRGLRGSYSVFADALRQGQSIAPAAVCLVDNFPLAEERLREIQEGLSDSFYYELPHLQDAEYGSVPRIYAIARAVVDLKKNQLDTPTLLRFMRAYLHLTPLSMSEIWAFGTMLRVVLVENLHRLALVTIAEHEACIEVERVADEALLMAQRQPSQLGTMFAGCLNAGKPLNHACVVNLAQRLNEGGSPLAPALACLVQQLSLIGQSVEEIDQQERERQSDMLSRAASMMTSMRLLALIDWRDFFESVSLVDRVLGEDPVGAYLSMDFSTRNRYRKVVESISQRTKTGELAVARWAVELARQAQQSEHEGGRRAHVGYYLIDEGLAELEKAFRYRPTFGERSVRLMLRARTSMYLGSFACLTSLMVSLAVFYVWTPGAPMLLLVITALLALVPSSVLALNVLDWCVKAFVKPRVLPRLDTSDGIQADAHTMVVVPALLTSEDAVQKLVGKLEVHYLANQDEYIQYALLGDFVDAPALEMAEDSALLAAALNGIKQLNARYDGGNRVRFHLFHRRRQWNESEGKCLGWERKRGKLHEFNRLLRGATDTSFVLSTSDSQSLARIRYVITLDSDTQLPRDAARQLIGVITHPLNRPHFDSASGRVSSGYAILQPRVGISLSSASRSYFTRIFSGSKGLDPYITAGSDVYQDLFGEGNYTGKGLYDVDAFEAALASRTPENSILSHDLFEGLFARTGLVTEVQMLDDHPSSYSTYAWRQHRWSRGDWQIARWVLPQVPDVEACLGRNPLSLISRWKILDNLRRSLIAPATLLLLVGGWTVLPGSPLAWTLFALLSLCFPVYALLIPSLLKLPGNAHLAHHFRHAWDDLFTNTAQILFTIVILPHQACLMSSAIARTFYRKLISHRHLLDWATSAQVEGAGAHVQSIFLSLMWPSELIVALVATLILLLRPGSLLLALPFLIAWAVSPLIAQWVSKPVPARRPTLAAVDVTYARLIARRTWRFFETFVGPDDHWLPPDNFQEDPVPVIAHRTSPTNIGVFLLSTLAAYDLGYLGLSELVERLNLTFGTLQKLARHRGHYFNWYETQALQPVIPQYVSTVDSGNLAGHLIAVEQACLEIPGRPLLGPCILNGLADIIALLGQEAAREAASLTIQNGSTHDSLRDEIDSCAQLLSGEASTTATGWLSLFTSLEQHSTIIRNLVDELISAHGHVNFDELHCWANALNRSVRSFRTELETLVPWATLRAAQLSPIIKRCSAEANASWQQLIADLDRIPTTAQLSDDCDLALLRLRVIHVQLEQCQSQENADRDRALEGLSHLTRAIEVTVEKAAHLLSHLNNLAHTSNLIVDEMDFSFLYSEESKVFSIGYDIAKDQTDNYYYDLLASEARLTSFVAIAKGLAPQEHWFRLGRGLTSTNCGLALISWAATMFEYLMPLIVMRNYDDTLLNEPIRAAVARHIEYAKERGIPWGISESACYARNPDQNYQYGTFGVPGLGLKRGLSLDLVIAPYATLLASMVQPEAAMANLRRLELEGALGHYGFYEAVDYTPERLPVNSTHEVVRLFMAHHQGMSLVALDNLLNDDVMQKRFHASPLVCATELLLQERMPRGVATVRLRPEEVLSGPLLSTPKSAGKIPSGRSDASNRKPVTDLFNKQGLHTPNVPGEGV